jgi:hypothetical protein
MSLVLVKLGTSDKLSIWGNLDRASLESISGMTRLKMFSVAVLAFSALLASEYPVPLMGQHRASDPMHESHGAIWACEAGV